ncbi:MAG TPA: TRAM domain-containing protein [Gemmatimonadaceae bacterium]
MTSPPARITIESIAGGGDGIGHLDGLAVFVPRTAPGDVVEATVRLRGRLGRGEVVRLIEQSPDRVAPRCRHYLGDDCGGCQLQHLSYEPQLEQKRRIVQDAFQRIARRAVDVPPVVPSPSQWGYRSRLTLAMRSQRGQWVIGLHGRLDPGRVFSLGECPITDDRVVAAWREVIAASALLPAAPELRGVVRLLGTEAGFVVEGGSTWPGARDFAARCLSLSVIRWRPAHDAPRVLVDRRSAGTPEESFEQVNPAIAAMARSELVERAMAHAPLTAVDAYAGLGATAGELAGRSVSVTVIESDEEAAAYVARRLPAVRVVVGRVEERLAGVLPADVIILNPPRAGIDQRVSDVLNMAPRLRCVLYMSCDPATLARDVGRLTSWRVASVRAYDMFPQTAHVEVVCELTPEAR